jgi:hypothetical protein
MFPCQLPPVIATQENFDTISVVTYYHALLDYWHFCFSFKNKVAVDSVLSFSRIPAQPMLNG